MSEGPEERWALLQRKLQMMEEEATCASKLMKQTWVVCPARGSAPDRSQITERAFPRALTATAAQTTLHFLYLRYAWDQELIHYQLFKGCQAKASQQPESLSRNLTFSFQSGEAKLKCFLPGGCFRERPAASPLSRNLWSIINTNVTDHYHHCYINI